MVQETFETHPDIREACNQSILIHAHTVARDLSEAKITAYRRVVGAPRHPPHERSDPLSINSPPSR
jgi:hypothetical protein